MAVEKPLIVVPAFNEAETVGSVVGDIQLKNPGIDVLVIDDGSTDSTADEAATAGATVVRLPFNLGVGGGMRLGFAYAYRNGYDAVVQCDADGQHDPSFIPDLLGSLTEADVVVGSRFASGDSYQVKGPRRWAMRLFAAVISPIVGTKLTDVTSGFRAASAQALPLFAADLPAEWLGDTLDSLVLASSAGLTVKEVPVVMRERAGGMPSQTAIKATIHLIRSSLMLVVASTRGTTPTAKAIKESKS